MRTPPRPRGLALALVVALARCSCDEGLEELVPDIDVADAPRALARQVVGVPVVVTVQVGNRGTGVLTLAARMEPPLQGFTVERAPDEIRPRQADDVRVTFRPPTQGSFAAELVLASNDPDEPEVRVPFTGDGGPPILQVTPAALDFGLVNEGAERERVVTVANVGFDVLTDVTATLEDGAAYTAVTDFLPARLLPGEDAVVLVHLAPDASTAALEDGEGLVHDALLVSAGPGGEEGTARVPLLAAVNLAPVAVAVEDRTRAASAKVGVGKPVVLDGSESADPEGDPITFSWTLLERPAGSFSALIGPDDVDTRLSPDEPGRYRIGLRVTDVHGASGTAEVILLPRDLAVVLRWSTDPSAACTAFDDAACAALPPAERDDVCCGQSDLDLHLVRPGGTLGDVGACPGGCDDAQCTELGDDNPSCRQVGSDCAWNNRAPEWAAPGRADDPRLDVDDVRGAGPEIVSIDEPEDGAYRAVVHYCTDRIGEPTLATVDIFVQGVLSASVGPALVGEGDAWTAATLVRADGAWTFVTPTGVIEDAPPGLCSP